MRNLFLRGGLLLLVIAGALGWGFSILQAQEDSQASASASDDRAGVLVMKSGKLVEGRISPNAGGYLVELPKGNYLVPLEQVSVVADDRHDAYEKLKAAGPNPSPEFRVSLARWCITWKLYDEARAELRDALIADPRYEEARRMYARLDRLMNSEQTAETKTPPSPEESSDTVDAESLAGLSPESVRDYVARVQPILLNRCGNAACHGPASGQSFQLTHVRRGLNRQTLRNLHAVLGYVNVTSPENSPLLKMPSGTHGRNGRPIFFGSSGEQNEETLKQWALQVAKELANPAEGKREPDPFARRDPLEEEPDETLIRGVPEPERTAPLTPEEQAAKQKEELLEAILRNEQQDAFDPDEFNRRFQ